MKKLKILFLYFYAYFLFRYFISLFQQINQIFEQRILNDPPKLMNIIYTVYIFIQKLNYYCCFFINNILINNIICIIK
jgi:hypothetical protein